MADTKKSKSKSKKPSSNNNIDHLKTDIASFASSLGLATSDSSGFNDVDFRPKKPQHRPRPSNTQKPKPQNRNTQNPKPNERPNFSKPNPNPFPEINTNNDKAKSFENLPKLPLISATNIGVWYEEAEELEAKVIGKVKKGEVRNDSEWSNEVAKRRKLGERLMAQYTADYEASKGRSGDIKLLLTTQRSGTASDKISAFSVLVGDDPIANLRSLDALLGMVSSKVGKRYAFAGFDALRELFLMSLLPDRKLKSLLQRPLNDLPETKDGYSLLLLWYWEESLKQRYERFVIAVEEASRDMLPELKNKALKTIYVLLKSKSEQERRLLSALVNKLGDPKSKGASDADFHLSNLLRDHPNMKAVVIAEVDSFLFRPHLNIQAKYHAVNFLSQIQLRNTGDGPKVAKSLVDVYFALFKVLISEATGGEKTEKNEKVGGKKPAKDGKGNSSSDSHVELDSRLLSALLMGVNRAFPYVSKNEADDLVEAQTPTLFHLVHSTNFNVGVQALMLLHHISSKNQIVSDRFYRALYSKLLLPAAMNTSKAETFIGLLLRAMKSDVNVKRTAAFAKRLLQVALQQPPQYACGCLFLLSEVLKARPPLWNMVLQNESVDDDLEHFEDVLEETDNKPSPVLEKQDVELVLNNDEKSDTAISEDDSSEDDIDSPASYSEDEASDEEDEFHLRKDSKDTRTVPDSSVQQPQVVSSEKTALPGGYDPRHREPSYCNADRVSWWELTVLASHVHPSVSTMAKTLLSGANIVYNGNPLNDLSLTAFLDKFMEKKPKASTWHGASQIEPAKKLDMTNRFIGPEILSLAEEDVPAEDLVFHKFYMNKMNTTKKPKKKKKKKATAEDEGAADLFDVDGGGDDESDNEEIDNMLDSAGTAMDADGDYDYDDLDQVANDDDEDLVGNVSDVSDAELDLPSDIEEGEDFDATADSDESDDAIDIGDEDDDDDEGDNDDAIDIGDADDDDDDDEEDGIHIKKAQGKSKRKRGKAGASPFASLEEYEHLFNEDAPAEKEPKSKKSKPRKKRKSSN